MKDDISSTLNGPDERHDRWLAMRTAYSDYMQASDALDSTYETADGAAANERLRMMILEGHHRTAFERYIESRMAFLESEFDDIRGPADGIATRGSTQAVPAWRRGWPSYANCRLLLESLAIILLCTTALSLIGAEKHMRDLETARQELETALKQNRDGLQALGQKVDQLSSLQVAATERVKYTSANDKPPRPASSRRASLRGSADRHRKHLATLHTQQGQTLRWYSSREDDVRRPKLSKPDSALSSARPNTRGGPRSPWWATPGASNSVDSRF